MPRNYLVTITETRIFEHTMVVEADSEDEAVAAAQRAAEASPRDAEEVERGDLLFGNIAETDRSADFNADEWGSMYAVREKGAMQFFRVNEYGPAGGTRARFTPLARDAAKFATEELAHTVAEGLSIDAEVVEV